MIEGGLTSYSRALNLALAEEMEADPTVHVFGEDVAEGGAFGTTRGLVDRFGKDRVRNTPISESTIVGLATGAAITGLRPVVEVMFIDFLTLAMDALVNHAAKLRFMSGGQLRVPLVLRTQNGAIGGAGAQHSQSLEAWTAHVPGLKVVTPATPRDARGLMRASIRDADPVVFIEHKGSYGLKEQLHPDDGLVAIGEATIRRHGSDLTIVCYGGAVTVAGLVASDLAERGIDAEVVDLRTLVPLDISTVLESVRKTGRVVVYHEAVLRAGFGAEIAARIQEEAFADLKLPVRRIGARAIPLPAAAHLESAIIPDRAGVLMTILTFLEAN